MVCDQQTYDINDVNDKRAADEGLRSFWSFRSFRKEPMGRYLALAREVAFREHGRMDTPRTAEIFSMSLEEFGRRHLAVKVKLPDGSTCWFVSGPDEGAALRRDGVCRGSIWTAKELADVMGAGWTRQTIGRLIAVKRTFQGTVEPASFDASDTLKQVRPKTPSGDDGPTKGAQHDG